MAYSMYWMRIQAQKKAAAQADQGGTVTAPPAVPVANGCPAPAPAAPVAPAVSKAVVEKAEPLQAVPMPLSTDGALESLSAGLTSSAPSIAVEEPAVCDSVQTTLRSSLPPADKKTKTEDEGSVPSEALNALGDLLPEAEPEPEPVKIDPKDIVTEGVVEDEEGVLVGENEESIPPEYRFSEENGTDLPPAKEEEPSVDSGEALDILSGDFKTVVTVPKQPQVTGLDMDVNLDTDVDDPPPVTDLAENFGSDMVPAQS